MCLESTVGNTKQSGVDPENTGFPQVFFYICRNSCDFPNILTDTVFTLPVRNVFAVRDGL